MHKLFGLSFLAIVVCVASPPASAGKYTGPGLFAEMTITDPKLGKGRYKGRYYFDRGGYRLEIDGRARLKSYVFNTFFEYFISTRSNGRMEIDEDQHGALAVLFGDAPCNGFRRAINVGTDSRGGRELHIWRCNQPKQPLLDAGFSRDYKITIWYDGELKHFVRKEANNGVTIELKKIVPGRQSPALFNIPAEAGVVSATDRIADVETIEQ